MNKNNNTTNISLRWILFFSMVTIFSMLNNITAASSEHEEEEKGNYQVTIYNGHQVQKSSSNTTLAKIDHQRQIDEVISSKMQNHRTASTTNDEEYLAVSELLMKQQATLDEIQERALDPQKETNIEDMLNTLDLISARRTKYIEASIATKNKLVAAAIQQETNLVNAKVNNINTELNSAKAFYIEREKTKRAQAQENWAQKFNQNNQEFQQKIDQEEEHANRSHAFSMKKRQEEHERNIQENKDEIEVQSLSELKEFRTIKEKRQARLQAQQDELQALEDQLAFEAEKAKLKEAAAARQREAQLQALERERQAQLKAQEDQLAFEAEKAKLKEAAAARQRQAKLQALERERQAQLKAQRDELDFEAAKAKQKAKAEEQQRLAEFQTKQNEINLKRAAAEQEAKEQEHYIAIQHRKQQNLLRLQEQKERQARRVQKEKREAQLKAQEKAEAKKSKTYTGDKNDYNTDVSYQVEVYESGKVDVNFALIYYGSSRTRFRLEIVVKEGYRKLHSFMTPDIELDDKEDTSKDYSFTMSPEKAKKATKADMNFRWAKKRY